MKPVLAAVAAAAVLACAAHASGGALHHYALHVVYWGPMPAGVRAAVRQLETDVKTSLDAGATDNPFAIPRAYGADPRIASIDGLDDAHPFPRAAVGYCAGVRRPCLGDPNLETEVDRLGRLHHWASGSRTLVLLVVAPSVTVCSRIAATNCTRGTEPCGFHGVSGQGFAYADVTMSGLHGRCGYGATPVWYATMLVTHEQNETVTEAEIADSCEGHFAIVAMNGHAYDLPAIELPSTKCGFGYR